MAVVNITSNGTEGDTEGKIAITPFVLGLVIAVSSVVLNGFLLLVLARERKSFLHMRVTYYIINLGIADFLNGAIISFLVLAHLFQFPLSTSFENIIVLFNWITIQCSFYTLVLMSIDRLVIVVYSLSWSKILTIKRTVISITAVWITSIAGCIFMHFYLLQTRLAITVFIELSIVIFMCNSFFIYPALRKRENGRLKTRASTNQRRVSYPLRYDNMSRVVLILVVALIITQLPFVIYLQMWLIHQLSGGRLLHSVRDPSFAAGYTYTQSFASLNFAINPIVYAWRIKKYREAFANTLC